MGDTYLWDADGLASTFALSTACTCISKPVLSGNAIFALQKHSKASSSSARRLYTFAMVGGEKLIGKAILLDKFLRKLGLRNLQTEAVLLENNCTSIHLPSW